MVKFRLRLVFILLICLLSVNDAIGQGAKVGNSKAEDRWQKEKEAQDGDRKRKKRKKKQFADDKEKFRQSAGKSQNSGTTKADGGKRKQELFYPATKLKNRYRVSVIVPLFLDELVRGESVTFKDKVPDKAAPGLAFYQGLKLAADSLRRAGAKMDIQIFDAGSFAESPDMLINNRKMDSTDLIIGAVEQHDIPVLASYAKKKRINFVSALTNYDGWVKDNQYFTMLQPTVKSHCEYIIDDLSAKYPGQTVTLLYRTATLADDNAALYMLNDLYSEVTFRKLLCNTLPTKEVLGEVLDTAKPNIVVVSIQEAIFADSILQSLAKNFPGTHFEIYGMPGWHTNANLRRTGNYRNLTVNVTYPFSFAEADSALLRSVQLSYTREFGGMPSEMVWRGYEAMLWYGNMIQRYGTIFNNDYKDISGAPFTKFRIKPRWDRNGSLLYLENKNIYMFSYQGGVYMTK